MRWKHPKKPVLRKRHLKDEQSWPCEEKVKTLPRNKSSMCKGPEAETSARVAGMWPVRRGHG